MLEFENGFMLLVCSQHSSLTTFQAKAAIKSRSIFIRVVVHKYQLPTSANELPSMHIQLYYSIYLTARRGRK